MIHFVVGAAAAVLPAVCIETATGQAAVVAVAVIADHSVFAAVAVFSLTVDHEFWLQQLAAVVFFDQHWQPTTDTLPYCDSYQFYVAGPH